MNQMMNNMGFNLGLPNPYQDQMNRYLNLQQQAKTNNSNVNFVIVENLDKAKQQVVEYGKTIWMRDASEPFIYIKSVDAIGTADLKVLKIEDVTNDIVANSQNNIVYQDYVQIQEFNELNQKVEQLQASIEHCNSILQQAVDKISYNSSDNNTVIDVEAKEIKKRGLLSSKNEKVGD